MGLQAESKGSIRTTAEDGLGIRLKQEPGDTETPSQKQLDQIWWHNAYNPGTQEGEARGLLQEA